MWDVNKNVYTLIDEFCRLFHGPAAKSMRAYYDLLETTAENWPPMFHCHKVIADSFDLYRPRFHGYIKESQEVVAGGPKIYREWVAFAAAGFRVAQLYISADQMVRCELANLRDPELRGKIRLEATNSYRDLLEMFQSSRCRSHLIEAHPCESDLRPELKNLEEGTSFGIGDLPIGNGVFKAVELP